MDKEIKGKNESPHGSTYLYTHINTYMYTYMYRYKD